MEDQYHLAQINIAQLLAPLDSAQLADFTNNLNMINQLGHRTPGFVWQLLTEDGDSTAFRIYGDADDLLINFTVWENIEALYDFAYKSRHVDFFRRRREWFQPDPELPTLTLWWIPAGHIPTLDEAREKIEYLRDHGPTPLAFTFKQRYSVADMLSAMNP